MIVSKTVLWNSATFLRATHYYLEAVVKESVQLYLYPPPETSWPVLGGDLSLPLLH